MRNEPISTFSQAERFLNASLKPEEISGAEREDRLRELLAWFDRFLDGNANPKWFRSHAYELCYVLATMPLYGVRSIDTVPIPQNEDQAAAMAIVGHAWLKENAPHRLKANAA